MPRRKLALRPRGRARPKTYLTHRSPRNGLVADAAPFIELPSRDARRHRWCKTGRTIGAGRRRCIGPAKYLTCKAVKTFTPHGSLRNGHLMTMAATFWRRRFPRLPAERHAAVRSGTGTKVRGECHWQKEPRKHATIVLLHGLEGSSESGYILGTAEKAWLAGVERGSAESAQLRGDGGVDRNPVPFGAQRGYSGGGDGIGRA